MDSPIYSGHLGHVLVCILYKSSEMGVVSDYTHLVTSND